MTDRIILNREVSISSWETVAELVARLQELGVPLESATFDTNWISPDWSETVVVYKSPETDAEYKKRIQWEKKVKAAKAEARKKKAEQERAEYERLKKKFGE